MDTHYLIAHATADENNGDYGGLAGSQIGFELHARTWYSRPWTHVYRAVDPEVAENIAMFMEKAISNGFIGYDCNTTARDTLYHKMVANGFKVDELNESAECDCSSLVYCAVYPQTQVDFIVPVEDASHTKITPKCRHYLDYLMNACAGMFTEHTEEKYLTSAAELKRGDILLNPELHIAVWI